MFDWHKPGFHFLSQENDWRQGYEAALATLAQASRAWLEDSAPPLLLLGPAIGEAGREWILAQHLRRESQVFGQHILHWDDWIRNFARNELNRRGEVFRELGLLRSREFLRSALEALESAGKLPSIGSLWREERFFQAILRELTELREAGFDHSDEVLRARDLLQIDKNLARVDPEELWYLLSLFEQQLTSESPRWYDRAATLRLAAGADSETLPGIFLLGFSRFSLLECELLRSLAQKTKVVIPVLGSAGDKHSLVKQVTTGYAGELQFSADPSAAAERRLALATAHTPGEEALSVGTWLRTEKRPARIVLAHSTALSRERLAAALGIDAAAIPGREKNNLLETLLQSLRLVDTDFSLDAINDYTKLLAAVEADSDYLAVGPWLEKQGFRKGLSGLKELLASKAPPAFERLVPQLVRISQALPNEASGREFADSLRGLLEESRWVELARKAESSRQREWHGTFAALLKAAAQLQLDLRPSWKRTDWLQELAALLERMPSSERSPQYESYSFHELTEWLPPSADGAMTVVLGLDHGASPRTSENFYLDDRDRAKLSDWLLLQQRSVDEESLLWFSQLARGTNPVVLSYAKHGFEGGEQGPSWLAELFGTQEIAWPEAPWPEAPREVPSESNFALSLRNFETISVTLLNAWADCPFRAWAEQIVRLQDGLQEAELDLPALDRGAVFHRAVELYFTEHRGHGLREPEAIKKAASAALDTAFAERAWQYFKGGKNLLEVYRAQLLRQITKMLLEQAGYFAETPELGPPLCEQAFRWPVPGTSTVITGKIDRIDRSQDGRHVLVVDYKTGSSAPSSKKVLANENLQLQLYLKHASADGAEPVGAYFLQLKSPEKRNGILRDGFRKKKDREGPFYYDLHARTGSLVSDEEFFNTLNAAEQVVQERVSAMARGEFPARPSDEENCERCAQRPLCRFHAQEEVVSEARHASEAEFREFRARLDSLTSDEVIQIAKAPTDEQQTALDARGKLVFIEASAGTGKTTVLVERICAEIAGGTEPEKSLETILAISFTEKSTQELKERLARKLFPLYGSLVAAEATHRVSTIHGFCGRVVRDFPSLAGVSPLVKTLTGLESRELQEEVLEELFIHPDGNERALLEGLYPVYSRQHIHAALLDFVGKRSLWEGDESLYRLPEAGLPAKLVALADAFFVRYDREKNKRGALDFNDLERLALRVLEKKYAYYRDQFSLIVVDEFQDTNSIQRRIVELIAAPQLRNLFVVGDAKQSIYRFRDADVAVFESLREQAQAQGSLYSLTKNFRSQGAIVDFVNALCSRVMPNPATPHAPYEASFLPAAAQKNSAQPVRVLWHEGEGKENEAELLAKQILSLVRGGRSPGEIAVLFRKLANNEAYARALKKLGLSTVQEGGEDFFAESIVLDGISLARALLSPWNNIAVASVLRSPWFSTAPEELARLVLMAKEKRQPLGELVEEKFKRWRSTRGLSPSLRLAYAEHPYLVDPRRRVQADKLLAWVETCEEAGITGHALVRQLSRWAGYEQKSSGIKEKRVPEPGANSSVRLSTIHAAKGLEYPVTFLVDLDSRAAAERNPIRYYPSLGLICKDPDAEEDPPEFTAVVEENRKREQAERKRLLYVALTRSQEELYLLAKTKESKQENWGDLLRRYQKELPLRSATVEGQDFGLVNVKKQAKSFSPAKRSQGKFPRHSSVSELAAYEFCQEFHRLKFVQSWEDSVLEFFPKDRNLLQRLRKPKNEESLLLKELGIEKKERGIALHRVLERVVYQSGPKEWEAWLRDIYVAQGVDPNHLRLSELLAKDQYLIQNFLASPPGQRLFAREAKAFSELPFVLDLGGLPLTGAVDRIVALSPSEWIVADYKSSLGEGNEARYTLQVWIYMHALAQALEKRGVRAKVSGLLVDLYELEWREIPLNVWNADELSQLFGKIRAAYTQQDTCGFSGGAHCFRCPYVTHCDEGRKTVLR